MIPTTFVEKYGEGLSKSAFLKAPNGGEWKVDLVKGDGKIWFQNGWKEFAEYHSLAEGHVVIFRYEKMTNFEVFIFDMSALEIEYPFKRVEGKRVSKDEGNKPQMVESLNNYRTNQKRKDNSSLEFVQQSKNKSRCVESVSILKLSKETMNHTGKKCNKEGQNTTAMKITALDRARSFKSCKPFCLVFMQPSYILCKANLNLPSKFGIGCFNLGIKRGNINLRSENGKVWPARYLIREHNMAPKFELSSGWKPFVMDNNLKVGDVCIFEFIDRTKLTLQVYIFRKTENSTCSTSEGFKFSVSSPKDEYEMCGFDIASSNFTEKPVIAAKNITALDRDSSFEVCNPSFQVVMQPSFVCSNAHLSLPSEFCERYFDLRNKRGHINLRMSNGRVQRAVYLIAKHDARTTFHLLSGWEAFAKENDLIVGAVCTFELIDRTKLTFQVYISRETNNSNCLTPQESADEPQNHESLMHVYSRKVKGSEVRSVNELGNRAGESVIRYSNLMDTMQQDTEEELAGIM
ncbi:hypothetical protein TanjilG_10489 [Lupinus angustifolius]|uniref:TF-B3 domain-containing protein n=2 Tax=Lupinus angustifolius TaxID=3871 RepID=A0A4P1R488_LUPAN|nr:hypothetical protein TanjilG_10489 [Lupinus angustifolius]